MRVNALKAHPTETRLARGAHRPRVAACSPIHDVKQRRHVSSLPRLVSRPGFDLSVFVSSRHYRPRLIPIPPSLSHLSPPCPRVALHRVRPRRGRRSAGGARVPREHPVVRAMTGTRALVRRSAPGATRMPRLSALHRGDFCIGQRFAACGIPFGLAPVFFSLSRPASGRRGRAKDLARGSY